jgi:hypothetical protein
VPARQEDLRGLWRRTVYRRAGEEPDCSMEVFWLQGPRFFSDLRQPVKCPSFEGVACLRDLTEDHLVWLARQEAFAGRLELGVATAHWHRGIDLQPPGQFPDRAQVHLIGDTLDEYGTEVRYYEQWVREEREPSPCWGARMVNAIDGRSAFLVRAAGRFMFARTRAVPLPAGRTLREALDGLPTLQDKQNLLDFEVSLGVVRSSEQGWFIERSTLPFKEGTLWPMRIGDLGVKPAAMIELDDLDPEGRRICQGWRILDTDGPLADPAWPPLDHVGSVE